MTKLMSSFQTEVLLGPDMSLVFEACTLKPKKRTRRSVFLSHILHSSMSLQCGAEENSSVVTHALVPTLDPLYSGWLGFLHVIWFL